MRHLVSCCLLSLAACGGSPPNLFGSADGGGGGGGAADMASSDDRYAPPGCRIVPSLSVEAEHVFDQADDVLTAGSDYLAVVETDAGRLVLDLLEDDAPITVNSFVFLLGHHYYDRIAFHRVIAGFMAQSGDPNSIEGNPSTWGMGGPGYAFEDEVDNGQVFSGSGILAMANSGPNTNGSQIFITFAAATHLNGKHTIFGKVSEGAKVLADIARGDPPEEPTRIRKAYAVVR